MRKTFFVRLVFLFYISLMLFSPCKAQHDRSFYEGKLYKYKGMRTTGLVLGISGVALLGTGIALLSSMEYDKQIDYYGNVSYTPKDVKPFISGIGCLIIGVPATATGVVFSIIGQCKVKKYSSKLKNLSIAPIGNRIYLSYRF
jgi:hypothetical protein